MYSTKLLICLANAIQWDEDLSNTKSEKHSNKSKIIDRLKRCTRKEDGLRCESIDYGKKALIDVILSLAIDEEIENDENKKNYDVS